MTVSTKSHQGVGGKIERKLSEVNTRTVSRGQNELTGESNMAARYVIIIGRWLGSTCTFQKKFLELGRFAVDCNQKRLF